MVLDIPTNLKTFKLICDYCFYESSVKQILTVIHFDDRVAFLKKHTHTHTHTHTQKEIIIQNSFAFDITVLIVNLNKRGQKNL